MSNGLKAINEIRKEFFEQGKDLVWHGMHFDKFKKLEENSGVMKAYTTQRYWKDGKLRKDNEPDYNDSYWYHGWSFSRSKKVSSNFGEILFAIDLNEVRKEFKVVPISWNFTIGRAKNLNHKKEQEEFVVAHKGKHSLEEIARKSQYYETRYDEILELLKDSKTTEKEKIDLNKEIKEIEDFGEINWFKKIMQGPKGKEMDINKFSKGFFVVNKFLTEKQIETLKEHPKFLGIVETAEINPDERLAILRRNESENTKIANSLKMKK